jgi:hypothetical protein
VIVVVDDRRQRVVIGGLSSVQFQQLAAVIHLARSGSSPNVRQIASELRLFVPCVAQDETGVLWPILQLTWEELFDLSCVMLWLLDVTAPHYHRLIDPDTLQALDAAFDVVLKSGTGRMSLGIIRG